MKFGLVAILGAALTLTACQKHEASLNEVVKDELLGNWHSSCVEGKSVGLSSLAALGISQRTRLSFEGSHLRETSSISSGACKGEDIHVTAYSTFRATGATSDSKQVEFKSSKAVIKPMTEYGVRILNIAAWCGIKDWKIKEPREITNELGLSRCFDSEFNVSYTKNARGISLRRERTGTSSTNPASNEAVFDFMR